MSLLSKTKIVDSFLFYNEFDLLRTRLDYYGNLVDKFIIVECDKDFSGKHKGFQLTYDSVSKLPHSEKITLLQARLDLTSFYWKFNKIRYRNNYKKYLWKIQDFQRNFLKKELSKFSKNDIVIFGDLDEFPSYSAIKNFSNQIGASIAVCNQFLFYYNIQTLISESGWIGTVIARNSELNNWKLHRLRGSRKNLEIIPAGGWHFSYFMTPDQVLNKVSSIADVENLSSFKELTLAEIQKKIANARDLYDREIELKHLDLNHGYIDPQLVYILRQNMPYIFK